MLQLRRRRRAAFFGTRGAPPTKIARCAAADTVMSAHGSTRTKPSGQKPPGQKPTAAAPGPRRRIFETGGASTPTKIDPSSEQGLLFVPFARTSTTQARAFSVVGPSVTVCGMGFLYRKDCFPVFFLT